MRISFLVQGNHGRESLRDIFIRLRISSPVQEKEKNRIVSSCHRKPRPPGQTGLQGSEVWGFVRQKNQLMVTDGGEQPGTGEIVMSPVSSGSWNVIGIRIM